MPSFPVTAAEKKYLFGALMWFVVDIWHIEKDLNFISFFFYDQFYLHHYCHLTSDVEWKAASDTHTLMSVSDITSVM